MSIDRCYCRRLLFQDLRKVADATGAGLEQLGERTGCGTGCGLCLPYLRVMLATGKTDLPVLSMAEVERLCAGSREAPAARAAGAPTGRP